MKAQENYTLTRVWGSRTAKRWAELGSQWLTSQEESEEGVVKLTVKDSKV